MKKDSIVDKQLEKTKHLPQFEKSGGRKFRFCRLCGRKLEAGVEYRDHMMRHY
jgi:hypothetical protein